MLVRAVVSITCSPRSFDSASQSRSFTFIAHPFRSCKRLQYQHPSDCIYSHRPPAIVSHHIQSSTRPTTPFHSLRRLSKPSLATPNRHSKLEYGANMRPRVWGRLQGLVDTRLWQAARQKRDTSDIQGQKLLPQEQKQRHRSPSCIIHTLPAWLDVLRRGADPRTQALSHPTGFAGHRYGQESHSHRTQSAARTGRRRCHLSFV